MTARRIEDRIELRGLPAGPVRAAIAVLNGATRAELARCHGLAATLARELVIVAVDGGLATCEAAGLRADLFVGDGDSVEELPVDLPAVKLPTDKDVSDLSAALAELGRRDVAVVVVAGLVGGRIDHEWSNLLELAAHAGAFAALIAPTERGSILVTDRGCSLTTRPGGIVSLFAMGAGATVTLRGPRWELERRDVRPGSLGLSNETGSRLDLSVHAGTAALIWDVDD